MAHAHIANKIAIATPASVSMPMTFRRWSRTITTPATTAITAVNLSHSFGSSLSFGFTESVRHRLERASHLLMRLRGAFEQKVSEHQKIHLRVHEAAVGVIRCADNRFAAHVERSIHQHATAGDLFPSFQQGMKTRI